MKTFKGDLILTKDTVFGCSIRVEGNITCKDGPWNITAGDIDALDITACDIDALDITACDITACDIDALDITAHNIDAVNITALDITAHNIDALNIFCEKRIKKSPTSKTICCILTQNMSKLKREEKMDDDLK